MNEIIKKQLIASNLDIIRQSLLDICKEHDIDIKTDNDVLNISCAMQNIIMVLKEA